MVTALSLGKLHKTTVFDYYVNILYGVPNHSQLDIRARNEAADSEAAASAFCNNADIASVPNLKHERLVRRKLDGL